MPALQTEQAVALLLLRLVIGFGFMAHGWAKLSRGPEGFAGMLAFIGVPFPEFMAWFVTLVELLGGFALMLGIFVRLLSAPLIAIHLVAWSTVHLRHGFSSVNTVGMSPDGPVFGPPGFEVNLLYIGGILVLAAFGPGLWSVRGVFAKPAAGQGGETVAAPIAGQRATASVETDPALDMTPRRDFHHGAGATGRRS